MLGCRFRRVIAGLAVAAVVAAGLPAFASGRPHRGHMPWSVLLCKFSDQAAEQQQPSFFESFLTQVGAGQGGAADYWRDISDRALDLEGSVVRGWYTMGVTLAQSRAPGKTRGQRIDDCVAAARAVGYTVPAGHRVIAIINGQVDSGGSGGRVLLDPLAWNVAFAVHEMAHGMDGRHSFSDDPNYRNVSWAQIGEYDDPWDLMSAMNVFQRTLTRFSPGPPGLNAEHRDRMGWLRRTQIFTMGADGVRTRTIRLRNLYAAGKTGIRIVRVPFDPADRFHYYTVELRMKSGWDDAIPANIVLIHEVKRNSDVPTTYLLRERTPARDPIQQLSDGANDVSIRVNSINSITGTASVTITSGVVDRCLSGYVWREARPSDHVCVPPGTRRQAREDNAAADSRRQPGGGASGPDTCRQGFVWREAFAGDHVCVTPATRTQAREDNARASRRRNPARQVFGPNTCKSGFVWREIDTRDWVCVRPAVRAQVRFDQAAAGSRRQPGGGAYGPNTCRSGFVWRDAFPGDQICVLPATRRQAREDNAAAHSRLLVP